MKTNSFYSEEELKSLGLKTYGNNVFISRFARFYGAENISIGNNVRIDDFCILSGKITLHNYIHISAYTCLFGRKHGIEMYDFSGLSSRGAVYADTDDYSGFAMTNPMVPDEYRNIIGNKVVFKKHVLVGTESTVLPGVVLGEGSSVGCMSLVNKSIEPWGIYAGIPCKRIKNRDKHILELENQLKNDILKGGN